MATSKFKDDFGRWLTASLFIETTRTAVKPLYCLTPENEAPDLPCLYKLYMECADPTEYKVATEYLGGWAHWERLQESWAFKPYLKAWRLELEVKLRYEGIAKQRDLAKKGNSNAAKWLAEKGWSKRKAGAPSKEEATRERKIAAAISTELDEDYKRLFN